MRPCHFSLRVDKHAPALAGREREVRRAVRRALQDLDLQATVQVHPSHVHVVADVPAKRELFFVSRLRNELAQLGVRWDAEHYVTPLASLEPEYVSRLLKELHRPPGR
ncbi:MAG: hypothetical protein HY520_03575 [Candidatus Aenigmarchaeota archaeon]|nr:hypothetical protein [Candidatus Aenigmarchaeota archaeon]